MRLWHGTTEARASAIVQEGIVPRGKRRSNWENASRADAVYLTDAYAMYFAAHAARDAAGRLAVVEIDTDLLPETSGLAADEDALWGAWRHGGVDAGPDGPCLEAMSLMDQAAYFAETLEEWRDAGFGHERSLALIGNCTYLGHVPPEAVTRVVTYPEDGLWRVRWHDPVISLKNFRFLGHEYRATQRVFAGRPEEAFGFTSPFGETFDPTAIEEEIAAIRRVCWEASSSVPCLRP